MAYTIALYMRLSLEDEKTDSLSIPNQRLILREKAMSLPEWSGAEILEFVDNGHTGTNFERPAVQRLLEMANLGKINCIMVKDLSRFGRNSIETGYFIEKVFPLYHIRFIAVSDNDSSEQRNYTFTLDNMTKADAPVYVWETRGPDKGQAYDANYFKKIAAYQPVKTKGGYAYSIEVKPYSIVTVTTLDKTADSSVYNCSSKDTPLKLSYTDKFEYSDEFLASRGNAPLVWSTVTVSAELG